MQTGDPVTAPHPLDGLSGGEVRVLAVFVGEVRIEPPKTLDGAQLEPVVLHRVRYADGREENWAEGYVLPAEGAAAARK